MGLWDPTYGAESPLWGCGISLMGQSPIYGSVGSHLWGTVPSMGLWDPTYGAETHLWGRVLSMGLWDPTYGAEAHLWGSTHQRSRDVWGSGRPLPHKCPQGVQLQHCAHRSALQTYGETCGAVLWGRAMGQSYGAAAGWSYRAELWGRAMGQGYGAELWGRAVGFSETGLCCRAVGQGYGAEP